MAVLTLVLKKGTVYDKALEDAVYEATGGSGFLYMRGGIVYLEFVYEVDLDAEQKVCTEARTGRSATDAILLAVHTVKAAKLEVNYMEARP